MANHSGVTSVSATLDLDNQDVVTLTGIGGLIEVANRGDEDLWVKVSDTDPGELDGGGDGEAYVAPGTSVTLGGSYYPTVVRLLGDSNPYTVGLMPRNGFSTTTPHNSLSGRSYDHAHPASGIDLDAIVGLSSTQLQALAVELLARIVALEADMAQAQADISGLQGNG